MFCYHDRSTCLSQTFHLLYFRLYPDANVTRLGPWAHFNCSYSCTYTLDPQDPLFLQIGSLYLSQVVMQFGTDHVYNTDTFNEMPPPSADPAYLSAVSRSVFASMTAGKISQLVNPAANSNTGAFAENIAHV